MKAWKHFIVVSCLLLFSMSVHAQENLAQQVFTIFQQNCLNCHGEHGAYTEQLIIEHTALVAPGGAIIPGNPQASEFYQRLIETAPERRMPLNAPPLSQAAIDTIRDWITVGAPDWRDTFESDGPFITPKEMLETIENHVNSLSPFDRPFARYFTLTHLYNAGETTEALLAYRRALSKLVNSLSWGRKISNPRPIDSEETIFYIDLRDYEWEIGTNRWTLIEAAYPYGIEFNAPTQTALREKLTNLREAMDCEVPFVHVDWFLATTSLPPLYHDILGLPETDRELETRLEVNVVENLRNAAGRRVWRAGFNDSGVSNHNRVVERHESRYGAYWKSYDFAGSVDTQNIFTHPLSFTHDGGEIIFNLPNGLQAYYLADAGGNRLNEAPIAIVRNPATSDPTVRNGLSCIGCHTEGMKEFEDQVRGVVEQNANPPFNKDRALRLYTAQATMDALVAEDTERYRQALEETGGVFGGIEPIQRFHEAFQGPVDASHAAAAVGLETGAFLQKIQQNVSLQNLGLLVLENGTVKRDAWTEQFSEVVFALDFPEQSAAIPVDDQKERIPGESVYIPDMNLRAAIAETLGKTPNAPITIEEMATLDEIAVRGKDISNLTGLKFATNIRNLWLGRNNISDLSPLAGLDNLERLGFDNNQVSDLSPLAGLTKLEYIDANANRISDLSPLAGLPNLKSFHSWHNPHISDISPLVGLKVIDICGADISDLSPLTRAINLKELYLASSNISDLSPLRNLTGLTRINFEDNKISDISPLVGLTNLKWIVLAENAISDLSPLKNLTGLTHVDLGDNRILSDISPLAELIDLEWLNLELNAISDASPLAGLTNLKWLKLDNNGISDFSPLDSLRENATISWVLNPGAPQGGPKIEGPWLWVIVPGERLDSGTDFLAQASSGAVTELQIAANGATVGSSVGSPTEGSPIGSNVWFSHEIAPEGGENINKMLDSVGIGTDRDDRNDHIIYGSVTLDSPREQSTRLFVGSNNRVKVWLNGQLIYEWIRAFTGAVDYHDFLPVTLRQGRNVLLVAVDHPEGSWRAYFGFEEDAEYNVLNPRVGYNFSEPPIHSGDTFTLQIEVEDVYDLAGWEFSIAFDPDVLKAVEVNEGGFLKSGGGSTFFQKGTIDNTTGKITKLSSARLSEDGVSGKGTLLSVTFTAKTAGQTQLKLENFQLAAITGVSIPAGPHEVVITVEGRLATGDVNRDGQVNILDMVLVARHFGKTVPADSEIDMNGDGVINIQDLIIVASNLGESTVSAAPSMTAEELNPAMIQAWIAQAQIEDDGSLTFQQGIANLQRLLAVLIPEETALLPNYPNPFNPETWIPYQLSEPAEVTLTIYAVNGTKVRTLALGLMPAGIYQSRSRAAYWDGRNNVGEPVASGVYFYTLKAGEFTSTRKMLIRK